MIILFIIAILFILNGVCAQIIKVISTDVRSDRALPNIKIIGWIFRHTKYLLLIPPFGFIITFIFLVITLIQELISYLKNY
jgi:hypothetical protein